MLPPNQLLLACVVVVLLASCTYTCDARRLLVLDVDGSSNSIGALVTILSHPTASKELTLVTVTGTAWGTVAAVERNVRGIIELAGRSGDVQVATGGSSTLSDEPCPSAVAHDSLHPGGSCNDERLFPTTPEMAAARSLTASRYDVDDLYGVADTLPRVYVGKASSAAAAAALSALIGAVTSSSLTRVDYIATASLTNLARFILLAKRQQGAQATGPLDSARRFMNVHVYENGNNVMIDPKATQLVLDPATRLYGKIYAPPFLAPVTFNYGTWSQVVLAARSTGSSAHFRATVSAWLGRKRAIEVLNNEDPDTSTTSFFRDHPVDASFVVMCVVDHRLSTSPAGLMAFSGAPQHVSLNHTAAPAPAVSYLVSGNNVTRAGHLVVTGASVTTAGFVVVSTPASAPATGSDGVTLLDLFWASWLALFRT